MDVQESGNAELLYETSSFGYESQANNLEYCNYSPHSSDLESYRRMQIPLPRTHHQYRHDQRFAQRTPRHMLQRQCFACSTMMWTTFDSSYVDVRCEKCFRDAVV